MRLERVCIGLIWNSRVSGFGSVFQVQIRRYSFVMSWSVKSGIRSGIDLEFLWLSFLFVLNMLVPLIFGGNAWVFV